MNTTRIGVRHSLAALLLGVLPACGGSGDSGSSEKSLSSGAISQLQGIYQLSGYTENPGGCDGPGMSTIDSFMQQNFVLAGGEFYGVRFLSLASCLDPPDCQTKADAISGGQLYSTEYSFTLSEEVSADHVTGLAAGTGFEENGVCTERDYTSIDMTLNGDALHLEARTTLLADAPTVDGFCEANPKKEREEAAGQPCSSLVVLDGTRLSGL